MDILIPSLVAGLLIGMVLALVALGLTIIFGVMDIVNFAHGEFLMVGMYAGLFTAQATGMEPLLTLPVAAAVGFLLGIIMEIPGIWDFLTFIFNSDWMADVPMISLKIMWVYLTYFVIMVVRPRGLFGWKK